MQPEPMTYPRAHLVDPHNGGVYHCISRCVRRSWLCGVDKLTGMNFEHRRAWLEQRVLHLCNLFAVDLHGYAIMSNHYHLVVATVPVRTASWSDEEVARRWCAIDKATDAHEFSQRVAVLCANRERLAVVRDRLGSLSWLMRFINEPLARMANKEDEVSGRFWEGRFKSVALLDEAAVLACMVYVDLNPVRAGIVEYPAEAAHTSFAKRKRSGDSNVAPLMPLEALGTTLPEYEALMELTASAPRDGTARSSHVPLPSLLRRQCIRPEQWHSHVSAHRHRFRAAGRVEALREYALRLGQHWVCAVRLA